MKPLCNHTSIIAVSPLWDNCGIGLKDKLQKFQNRAARVITGSTYDVRSIDMLNYLGWETLEQRCNYTKSMLMYKISSDRQPPHRKIHATSTQPRMTTRIAWNRR